MKRKAKTVKPGIVQNIIPPPHPRIPEKAEIAIEGADHLYREIRIENHLEDENGKDVKLKQGAKVDVAVEAEPEATVPDVADKKTDRKQSVEQKETST
jgi:hypothetical protein